MSCASGCYEATIESCNEIIIRAGLPATTPLYWILSKTGTNNIHQRLVTTGVDGDLQIHKTDLPDGFLIARGTYKIQIRSGADYLQPVEFTFGETNYSCIMMSLRNFNRSDDDSSEVNVIQFTASIIPEGSGSGGVFE